MPKSSTTLKPGETLPQRGRGTKGIIMDAMRAESFEMLTKDSTNDDAEVAYFRCIVKRAKNSEDKDSAMLLKFLGDKGWSNVKPTMSAVEFDFPMDGTPAERAFAVVEAISKGSLTPDVGSMIVGIVKDAIIIEESTVLKEQLEDIKKSLGLD